MNKKVKNILMVCVVVILVLLIFSMSACGKKKGSTYLELETINGDTHEYISDEYTWVEGNTTIRVQSIDKRTEIVFQKDQFR